MALYKVIDSAALDTGMTAVADAIRAKAGLTDPLVWPDGFKSAIDSIPSRGELPVLTNPAAAGDVIAGKEYIDASGAKKAGTLVVCDTIREQETSGIAGTGVSLELESTADGSTKTMTLPEPNLVAESIVEGSSIFGVPGAAKTLLVDTGTFTLAEDAQAPEVIHNLGVIPDLVIVEAADHDNTAYSILGFMAFRPGFLSSHSKFSGIIFTIHSDGTERVTLANDNGANAFNNGLSDTGFVCAYNSGNYKYRAGWTYKWKVFAGLT